MPPKRRREGRGGGSPPSPELKKRSRSFDLEIRGCRHLQEIATTSLEKIETAISRIPEEVTRALTSFFNRVPGARTEQNLPPTYRLSFVNSLSDEIFTKREVQAADGRPIRIRISASNQQASNYQRLLTARIKIVVLDGDFNADSREVWTSEEFSKTIIRPRDKVGVVLTGDLELKLKNGEASIENIAFVDNSRFTRSGKFRLGVRLIDDLGERVQEGITGSFVVKDRRGEGYKKRDIPRLDDEVWRLKRIAKNGVLHKALKRSGIPTVKHLLRLYYKDAKALRDILNKPSQLVWTTIVDHAKKCDPGRALYSHFIEDKGIRLYFNSTGHVVGATIADQYNAFGDLDTPQKALLEEWSKDAYECMTYDQPDYEMHNSQPRQIKHSTFQGPIASGPKSTELTDKNIDEAVQQDTSNGNELSGNRAQQCTFKRLGSVRVRPLPSGHENSDVSFDIDVQLDSGTEIQHETPDANCITGSLTLHCPTTAANEIIGSLALDQATREQGNYEVPFTDDDSSLHQWCQEQQVASQCASPFSLSVQADLPVLSTQNSFIDSEYHEFYRIWEQNQLWHNFLRDDVAQFPAPNVIGSPADVGCSVTRLASCRSRWIKLTALVKWMAMLRAFKSKAHD